MNDSRQYLMTVFQNHNKRIQERNLIIEEPLSIRVDGKAYSVVMRTPGDELAHVAGFCLAEGLVDRPEDIASLGFCTEEGTNVATVILSEARREKVADLLERKGFVSQTSCGICGKEIIEDLHQIITPVDKTVHILVHRVREFAESLSSFQDLHKETNSSHASLIADSELQPMAFAEDVGRHNALDKAIGKAFMNHQLPNAVLGLMSSRLSFELVQKAARARLQILIGISRPTALAVDLAKSINMTIVCARKDELMVFCGEDRLLF